MEQIPLTIDDLMAQTKGCHLYRITITSSRANGVFWNYDEYCNDFEHAEREANKIVEKHHSDIHDSWHGRVTEIQALGVGSSGAVQA